MTTHNVPSSPDPIPESPAPIATLRAALFRAGLPMAEQIAEQISPLPEHQIREALSLVDQIERGAIGEALRWSRPLPETETEPEERSSVWLWSTPWREGMGDAPEISGSLPSLLSEIAEHCAARAESLGQQSAALAETEHYRDAHLTGQESERLYLLSERARSLAAQGMGEAPRAPLYRGDGGDALLRERIEETLSEIAGSSDMGQDAPICWETSDPEDLRYWREMFA